MRALGHRSRFPLAVVVFVLALFALPGASSAHTDFDFSLPTDGASVGSPVDEVTVAFTSPVELVGNGFEALDPQGNVLQPFAVTDDDQVFRLQFDPPLAGGAVGVRYEVRADDGHVLSGSFSFVVDAPVPTTAPTTAPPVATAPTTVAPAVTEPAPGTTEPVSTTTVASAAGAPTSTADTTTTSLADATSSDDGSNIGLILVIVAAVGVGAGGFFLIRSRTSGAP